VDVAGFLQGLVGRSQSAATPVVAEEDAEAKLARQHERDAAALLALLDES
jgi:hypothetical protein